MYFFKNKLRLYVFESLKWKTKNYKTNLKWSYKYLLQTPVGSFAMNVHILCWRNPNWTRGKFWGCNFAAACPQRSWVMDNFFCNFFFYTLQSFTVLVRVFIHQHCVLVKEGARLEDKHCTVSVFWQEVGYTVAIFSLKKKIRDFTVHNLYF